METAIPHEQQPVVTREMLERLPPPVERYLAYSGIVGKPFARSVRLWQAGRIRQDEGRPWMPFTAEQSYMTDPPSFVWNGSMRVLGLPLVKVRDSYEAGHGNMLVRAAGLFTLADARGLEIDQGSLMRYLNEMMWFPTAYLGDNISWQGIDDRSAEVTLTDRGQSVTATLHFDVQGKLTNFVAPRYRTVGSSYYLQRWETPITKYGRLGGLNLPVGGRGVWRPASGDITYIELSITKVESTPLM